MDTRKCNIFMVHHILKLHNFLYWLKAGWLAGWLLICQTGRPLIDWRPADSIEESEGWRFYWHFLSKQIFIIIVPILYLFCCFKSKVLLKESILVEKRIYKWQIKFLQRIAIGLNIMLKNGCMLKIHWKSKVNNKV